MSRTVRYHPLFENDVNASFKWYSDRSSNVADDFLTCLREAVDRLLEDPERKTPFEFGMRYWPVARFPYVVFYDVTKNAIQLLGVMHTSKDSRKWLSNRR
jgi:toxin ParE1/3/4